MAATVGVALTSTGMMCHFRLDTVSILMLPKLSKFGRIKPKLVKQPAHKNRVAGHHRHNADSFHQLGSNARFLEVHGIDLVIEADLQRILSINEGILK